MQPQNYFYYFSYICMCTFRNKLFSICETEMVFGEWQLEIQYFDDALFSFWANYLAVLTPPFLT